MTTTYARTTTIMARMVRSTRRMIVIASKIAMVEISLICFDEGDI